MVNSQLYMKTAMKKEWSGTLRKWKSDIEALGIIICFYLILEIVLGITCPIKFLTGISDAGCGMSRAWMCVLRLDFKGAFYYHPLWMLPVPAVLVFMIKKKLPKRVYQVLVAAVISAFVMVYLYRMFFMPDQDIVVFRPWEGFIWRTVQFVSGFLEQIAYTI